MPTLFVVSVYLGRAFGWCVCENVDSNEDNGHADDVIEGEMGANPEVGENTGGDGFDAGNDAGFDRANFCNTGQEGGKSKDGADDDKTGEGEHAVQANGWLIAEGASDDGEHNATNEHGPSCDRKTAPFLDDADRNNVVGS